MNNKTLIEFMSSHQTMVEDLRVAANLLPKFKRSTLVGALRRYASELAEYDPAYSGEYISPFKIMTINKAVADAVPAWKEQTDWEISPKGDLCHKKMGYNIYNNQLNQNDWILHMMEKGWCDLNTFIPAYFEACRRAGINSLKILSNYK